MSSAVITIPCDRVEWGPLTPLMNGGCVQVGSIFQGPGLQPVCSVTLHWPTPTPQVPALCRWEPRHAGERD